MQNEENPRDKLVKSKKRMRSTDEESERGKFANTKRSKINSKNIAKKQSTPSITNFFSSQSKTKTDISSASAKARNDDIEVIFDSQVVPASLRSRAMAYNSKKSDPIDILPNIEEVSVLSIANTSPCIQSSPTWKVLRDFSYMDRMSLDTPPESDDELSFEDVYIGENVRVKEMNEYVTKYNQINILEDLVKRKETLNDKDGQINTIESHNEEGILDASQSCSPVISSKFHQRKKIPSVTSSTPVSKSSTKICDYETSSHFSSKTPNLSSFKISQTFSTIKKIVPKQYSNDLPLKENVCGSKTNLVKELFPAIINYKNSDSGDLRTDGVSKLKQNDDKIPSPNLMKLRISKRLSMFAAPVTDDDPESCDDADLSVMKVNGDSNIINKNGNDLSHLEKSMVHEIRSSQHTSNRPASSCPIQEEKYTEKISIVDDRNNSLILSKDLFYEDMPDITDHNAKSSANIADASKIQEMASDFLAKEDKSLLGKISDEPEIPKDKLPIVDAATKNSNKTLCPDTSVLPSTLLSISQAVRFVNQTQTSLTKSVCKESTASKLELTEPVKSKPEMTKIEHVKCSKHYQSIPSSQVSNKVEFDLFDADMFSDEEVIEPAQGNSINFLNVEESSNSKDVKPMLAISSNPPVHEFSFDLFEESHIGLICPTNDAHLDHLPPLDDDPSVYCPKTTTLNASEKLYPSPPLNTPLTLKQKTPAKEAANHNDVSLPQPGSSKKPSPLNAKSPIITPKIAVSQASINRRIKRRGLSRNKLHKTEVNSVDEDLDEFCISLGSYGVTKKDCPNEYNKQLRAKIDCNITKTVEQNISTKSQSINDGNRFGKLKASNSIMSAGKSAINFNMMDSDDDDAWLDAADISIPADQILVEADKLASRKKQSDTCENIKNNSNTSDISKDLFDGSFDNKSKLHEQRVISEVTYPATSVANASLTRNSEKEISELNESSIIGVKRSRKINVMYGLDDTDENIGQGDTVSSPLQKPTVHFGLDLESDDDFQRVQPVFKKPESGVSDSSSPEPVRVKKVSSSKPVKYLALKSMIL